MQNDIENPKFRNEADIEDLYETIADSYRKEIHPYESTDPSQVKEFVEGFRQHAIYPEGLVAEARRSGKWKEEIPPLSFLLDTLWEEKIG